MLTVLIKEFENRFQDIKIINFYKLCLRREKYPSLHNYILFVSLLFGSTYKCEQLFSRMKYGKNKISSKKCNEHYENSLRTATTSTEPD